MPKILVLQHVAAEPLGTLDALIRRRGHRIRFVNFERDPEAIPSIDRYRGLIVLGGPMNVDQQHLYPHLSVELDVIEATLKQNKPVLGICLGAQLLAHALGAKIDRNPIPEIGWYVLQRLSAGADDAVLGGLARESKVFQWHTCRFDVPAQAVHLASTETCAPQAFRYRENAYGFQFHLEMDQPLIERWLAQPAYAEELRQSRLATSAEQIRLDSQQHISAMQSRAEQVFGRFLDLIGRPAKRAVLTSR